MSRPLILVSNDDGVDAPGIAVLADFARAYGDVVVCAPSDERSGASHAITLRSSLRTRKVSEGCYSVTGTPVDCVYLAALHLCERIPDIVLSGVNAGYNLGVDVFYSGTVGAAREGLLRGASAMAISMEAGGDPKEALPAVGRLLPGLIAHHQRGERHLLNINVPIGGAGAPIEMTRLGRRRYRDQVERREDLQGRPYFWIGGPPAPIEEGEGQDIYAVKHGRVAVTPLELDITAPEIEGWERWLEESES